MKKVGIYVHIPFCVKKCKYCDFVSFENKFDMQEKYVKCLTQEIDNCNITNFEVDTIYFGGGTPSSISVEYIGNILEKIRNKFKVREDAEITIEVNPGTVLKENLEYYKRFGFNRISIGLQSTKDELLKTIGRIHTYSQFVECFKNAREVGFQNINVDLMLGLPTQTIKDLEESLNEVVNLGANHISLYSLIVEEGTVLKQEIDNGLYVLPSEDEERKMYDYTKKLLEKNNYIHYEISNFSKKGFESKHNLNCWNQEEYLGFGLSAHSYFDKKRFSNTSDFEKYLSSQKENIQVNEVQTSESQKKEYMLLGFRKIQGISISEFERKFGIHPLFYFRFEISKLVQKELIEVDLDSIRLTRKGLDLANLVFEEFV